MKNQKQLRATRLTILITLTILASLILQISSFAVATINVSFEQGKTIAIKAFDGKYLSTGIDGKSPLKNTATAISLGATFLISKYDGTMRIRSLVQKDPYVKFFDFVGNHTPISQSNKLWVNSIAFSFSKITEGPNTGKFYILAKRGGYNLYLTAHKQTSTSKLPVTCGTTPITGSVFTIINFQ